MPSKASDYRVEAAAALSKGPTGGTGSLRRFVLLVGLVLAALALFWSYRRLESLEVSPYPVAKTIRFRPEIATLPVMSAGIQIPTEIPVEFEFRRGETLSDVLDVLGFEPLEAHVVATEVAKHADLRKLRPRDRYAALFDGDSTIKRFQITLVGEGKVAVRRGSDGEWAGSWEPFVRTVEVRSIDGELSGVLEESIKAAGGDAQLAYMMSDVFQWDLDFNRDLRLGDRFEVLFEEVRLDGEYSGPGEILGLPLWRPTELLRRRGPTAAQDVPALTAALLAGHVELLRPPFPPGAQALPASLWCRLWRADGYSGAGNRQRCRDLGRLEWRGWQDGQGPPPQRLSHRLPTPVAICKRGYLR
jgi:hypothetical protein